MNVSVLMGGVHKHSPDLTGDAVLPVVTVIEFVCQSQPHSLNWITQSQCH